MVAGTQERVVRFSSMLLMFVMLIILSGVVGVVEANDEAQTATQYQLDIPRQSVAEALNRLAKQTGRQILFSSDLVANLNAQAVQGIFTLEKALEQLLQGTGLSSGLTEGGAIIIAPQKKNDEKSSG